MAATAVAGSVFPIGFSSFTNTTSRRRHPSSSTFNLIHHSHRLRLRHPRIILRAIEEKGKQQEQGLEFSAQPKQEAEEEETASSSPPPPEIQLKEKEGGDLWSGVAEEIREIEWPAFGKVVGITGVVLGVIAGSSLVLLTVNALLAELSDRVFVGRGVQDFFG